MEIKYLKLRLGDNNVQQRLWGRDHVSTTGNCWQRVPVLKIFDFIHTHIHTHTNTPTHMNRLHTPIHNHTHMYIYTHISFDIIFNLLRISDEVFWSFRFILRWFPCLIDHYCFRSLLVLDDVIIMSWPRSVINNVCFRFQGMVSG